MSDKREFVEWDWGKDLEAIDKELEAELVEMDKRDEKTDWSQIHLDNKNQYARFLKEGLGEDIKKVTSGQIKVKLPMKLRVKRWFERIFKMF